MEIINDIFELKYLTCDLCLAIGVFDGLHHGHKNVITSAVKQSKEKNYKSVVFTFSEHPKSFMSHKTTPQLIYSKEEKIYLLKKLDVDYVVFQKFDKNFSNLTPLEFVELLKNINTKEIYVGFNFRFGAGGAATSKDMIKMGETLKIKVHEIKPVLAKEKVISSTLIREYIAYGDLERVKKLLGHNLFMIGNVIHGKKNGHKLGYPTANLNLIDKIYPPYGIYGATVQIEGYDKIYDGVVNIGKNPTLKNGEFSVEVHILDFVDYIYGREIIIELKKQLRNEKKFNSMDELKAAIANDILIWKEHLSKFELTKKYK